MQKQWEKEDALIREGMEPFLNQIEEEMELDHEPAPLSSELDDRLNNLLRKQKKSSYVWLSYTAAAIILVFLGSLALKALHHNRLPASSGDSVSLSHQLSSDGMDGSVNLESDSFMITEANQSTEMSSWQDSPADRAAIIHRNTQMATHIFIVSIDQLLLDNFGEAGYLYQCTVLKTVQGTAGDQGIIRVEMNQSGLTLGDEYLVLLSKSNQDDNSYSLVAHELAVFSLEEMMQEEILRSMAERAEDYSPSN